jgi:hypothetical protein
MATDEKRHAPGTPPHSDSESDDDGGGGAGAGAGRGAARDAQPHVRALNPPTGKEQAGRVSRAHTDLRWVVASEADGWLWECVLPARMADMPRALGPYDPFASNENTGAVDVAADVDSDEGESDADTAAALRTDAPAEAAQRSRARMVARALRHWPIRMVARARLPTGLGAVQPLHSEVPELLVARSTARSATAAAAANAAAPSPGIGGRKSPTTAATAAGAVDATRTALWVLNPLTWSLADTFSEFVRGAAGSGSIAAMDSEIGEARARIAALRGGVRHRSAELTALARGLRGGWRRSVHCSIIMGRARGVAEGMRSLVRVFDRGFCKFNDTAADEKKRPATADSSADGGGDAKVSLLDLKTAEVTSDRYGALPIRHLASIPVWIGDENGLLKPSKTGTGTETAAALLMHTLTRRRAFAC